MDVPCHEPNDLRAGWVGGEVFFSMERGLKGDFEWKGQFRSCLELSSTEQMSQEKYRLDVGNEASLTDCPPIIEKTKQKQTKKTIKQGWKINRNPIEIAISL